MARRSKEEIIETRKAVLSALVKLYRKNGNTAQPAAAVANEVNAEPGDPHVAQALKQLRDSGLVLTKGARSKMVYKPSAKGLKAAA